MRLTTYWMLGGAPLGPAADDDKGGGPPEGGPDDIGGVRAWRCGNTQ